MRDSDGLWMRAVLGSYASQSKKKQHESTVISWLWQKLRQVGLGDQKKKKGLPGQGFEPWNFHNQPKTNNWFFPPTIRMLGIIAWRAGPTTPPGLSWFVRNLAAYL